MKFTVNRPAFCEALKTVMNVGKSSLLTRISGIYLYADASKRILELIGTDVITSVVKRIRDADISMSGEIILPPIVLEILKKTKEESVTIETDENGALGLSFGSARYLLVTKPVNEFPKSELVFPTAYVSVSGLLPLLKHAAFAAETKGDKRELQGVTLRLTPGISTAEAMNQKRMASAVNRNAADGETEMKLHKARFCAFLDEDNWVDSDFSGNSENRYIKKLDEFIDSLDDNTVLVAVDCHN